MKHNEIIYIFDFGSQYTQLIAKRLRAMKIYCEIVPYNYNIDKLNEDSIKGIILSGGPNSVFEEGSPIPDKKLFSLNVPILGICYGMQLMAYLFGGKVEKAEKREYGRANLLLDDDSDLLKYVPNNSVVWMSHGDSLVHLPDGFTVCAHTENTKYAAMKNSSKNFYAVQFHPEVVHSEYGNQILHNFAYLICKMKGDWNAENFIEYSIKEIKKIVKNKNVILGLSGGVDSSVAAILLEKAIGKQLHCIFVNNGLLRMNEADEICKIFQNNYNLNFHYVDASKKFLNELKNITDPEKKRKIIGKVFIDVFQEEAEKIENVEFLAQGTLYPDIIESVSYKGPSVTIKSHHNVGGLPEKMNLKLLEPFRELFKDEVREIGKLLNVPDFIINRHPFPGPGLAIRVIGDITEEKLNILRKVDNIFINELHNFGLYNTVWQAFAVFLPVQSVGVMGDERTYENLVALRAVTSVDGMTADWAKLPYEFLEYVSNKIINNVKGVNRVVYDISSKPPATIEWE